MSNIITSGTLVNSFTYNDENQINSNIWFTTPEPERYLYHYTDLKTLGLILYYNTIRFSTLRNTNDPREYKDIPLNLIGNARNKLKRREKAINYLSEAWCLCCFSMDNDSATNGKYTKDISLQFRGYNKPRMWDQYAQEHKGVCIVFEKTAINNAINNYTKHRKLYHQAVKYSPPISTNWRGQMGPYDIEVKKISNLFGPSNMKKHVDKYYEELYFTKHPDWQDETEYRFLIEAKKESIVDVDFGSSLVGVAFGENAIKEYPLYVKNIARCLHSSGIGCCSLNWTGAETRPSAVDIGDGWANL